MSSDSAAWMFFSILAICFTWYKISTFKRDDASERSFTFKLNGEPMNGSIELTTNGETSRFRVIDGKIQ